MSNTANQRAVAFKYIICWYYTGINTLLLASLHHLNTLYVDIKPLNLNLKEVKYGNLNTLYVDIKRSQTEFDVKNIA